MQSAYLIKPFQCAALFTRQNNTPISTRGCIYIYIIMCMKIIQLHTFSISHYYSRCRRIVCVCPSCIFPAPGVGLYILIWLVCGIIVWRSNGRGGSPCVGVCGSDFAANDMELEDSRVLAVIAISLSTFHEKLFAFQCNFTACSINLHKFLPAM